MWTLIGVGAGLAVMLVAAVWYIRRAESNDIELEVAKMRADTEKARRLQEEEVATKEAARRMDEFNKKAAAVTDSKSAAELLNESARRTTS